MYCIHIVVDVLAFKVKMYSLHSLYVYYSPYSLYYIYYIYIIHIGFYWIWWPYIILLCGLFINMYRNIYINSQFIKLYTISGRDDIHSLGVAYSWRSLCAVDGASSQIICDYKELHVEKCLKIKSICCEMISMFCPPLILCNPICIIIISVNTLSHYNACVISCDQFIHYLHFAQSTAQKLCSYSHIYI